jgi:ElaA protein
VALAVHAKLWPDFTADEAFDMAKLRSDVFFLEQRITEEELDRHDRAPDTRHYWVADDRGFAAYLRVVADPSATTEPHGASHSIGRVVVRPDRRGEGLARELLNRVIGDYGHLPMVLHAQTYIAGLYRSFGFREFGQEYLEAGLPHVSMLRSPDHQAGPLTRS